MDEKRLENRVFQVKMCVEIVLLKSCRVSERVRESAEFWLSWSKVSCCDGRQMDENRRENRVFQVKMCVEIVSGQRKSARKSPEERGVREESIFQWSPYGRK